MAARSNTDTDLNDIACSLLLRGTLGSGELRTHWKQIPSTELRNPSAARSRTAVTKPASNASSAGLAAVLDEVTDSGALAAAVGEILDL